jgi:MFS family permease
MVVSSKTPGKPPGGGPVAPVRSRPAMAGWIVKQPLERYPDAGLRYVNLALVVLATAAFYYLAYVQYSVSASTFIHFGLTYTFAVYIGVAGTVLGAFATLLGGLADRLGRRRILIVGLTAVSLLIGFAVPQAPNKWWFFALLTIVGCIEGAVLVVTPALTRDFSPQLDRATAMGLWTVGPGLGTLAATVVASATLHGHTTWQDEFLYAGLSGLASSVLVLLGLRELSPALRDQIMVRLRERTLIEVRARGLDTERALHGHWRQMLRPVILVPSFAVSVFLLFYYAAVGSLVLFFLTVFGYSQQHTNALANWYWSTGIIAAVLFGLWSDKLAVRKPFMVIGAAIATIFMIVFAVDSTHPHTSYTTFVILLTGISFFGTAGYVGWMAAFTETVERRNPAAIATGLAAWGWLLRLVVAVSTACLPLVITSITPLIDHGAQVSAAATAAAPAQKIINAHPALSKRLAAYPPGAAPPALTALALHQIGPSGLATLNKARPDLTVLDDYGHQVQQAVARNATDWQRWWWICVGGNIVFIAIAPTMAGRWSPAKAREDILAHDAAVDRELAKLGSAQ